MKVGVFLTGLAVLGPMMLMTGCSSVKVWPFEDDNKPATATRKPENATEYRCEGGKIFYVRYLDAGKSAWVILPDRQVRLDKVAGDSDNRYSNGIATLRIEGADASLADGPSVSYSACKTPGAGGGQ